jgi:hypothetical protein
MFDTSWVAGLSGEEACAAVVATQEGLREQEWREVALAAHWAVLHDGESVTGPSSPGGERSVRAGGDGTPEVSEFACAELGMLMGTGFIAASTLIRDAVDLQHRHPRMWEALAAGRARVWKARQVARWAHAAGLTREQAWFLDAATTPYVDSLTWSAFSRLVEAKIIEADPRAAEARRLAAAMARFVATGQSDEHGLKTLIARGNAGEIIYFVAMCDRIAQILRLQGDPDPVDVRRSKALAILANPVRAQALLERYASDAPHPDDPAIHSDAVTRAPAYHTAAGPDVDQDREAIEDRAAPLDPEKLRPRAVLYVRVTRDALRAGTGVAHCESGVGPVTVAALRDLLGHYHVTVRPVLDLRGQVPVDAYEVPHAMREALRLARPSSVFPWSRSTRIPDLDHTRPYLAPEDGGPPGQTRPGNLGPLVRFGHRVKTHARGWSHRQPVPGTYLWRTPHGYWFRVDTDGTHPLGRDPDLSASRSPTRLIATEQASAELVLSRV